MANARRPNATYIALTRVGGFALGDAKNLRHPMQKKPTVGIFASGDAKVPNPNGFASKWNIGFTVKSIKYKKIHISIPKGLQKK